MDFQKFERQKKFTFLDFASFTKDGVQDTLEEILATISSTNAKRVVLDSFSAISLAFEDQSEARTTVQVLLGKMMRSEGVTTMLVIEVPIGSSNIGSGIEESVADGIVQLDQQEDNASPLVLRVLKMRCTAINRESHICTIGKNGMVLYPKQSIKLTYQAAEVRTTSGIPGLDERIEDGLIRGTTTAVIGATGTAKSTLSFQFIAGGISKNEAGIFCTLEQSADEIRLMGKGYGYNMTELERNGLSIFVRSADEESPDEFIANLAAEIKRTRAKRLVIDSLSVFAHKYKNEMYTIAKRIISLIHEYQVTAIVTIHTTQTSGLDITEWDLSSLLQNILVLRFVEVQGRMKRILLILKTRGSRHDESILEFKISKDKGGAEIAGSIENGYVGILTGIAQRGEEKKDKYEKNNF
jgi:circadian clock protein KaiC